MNGSLTLPWFSTSSSYSSLDRTRSTLTQSQLKTWTSLCKHHSFYYNYILADPVLCTFRPGPARNVYRRSDPAGLCTVHSGQSRPSSPSYVQSSGQSRHRISHHSGLSVSLLFGLNGPLPWHSMTSLWSDSTTCVISKVCVMRHSCLSWNTCETLVSFRAAALKVSTSPTPP